MNNIQFGRLFVFLLIAAFSVAGDSTSPDLTKPRPLTMVELKSVKREGVAAFEVSDYTYGNYRGSFTSPPSADLNPRKAIIVVWKDLPYRFVFSHEASYCPFFELASGAGLSYQFWEGNDGWAELFNQWGRQERNSFVEIMDAGPQRVWIRWHYFGVNLEKGQPAYRATEDFWAYPNGLILRKQRYETLMPGQHRGYTREPIEMIGMTPVGKLWSDVLAADTQTNESHALAVLDAFSSARYDVFWKPIPGTLLSATGRRSGNTWRQLDDARGVALVVPMKDGAPFCIFGDASGFGHDYTRIKEHTFRDTGGEGLDNGPGEYGWISSMWNHWPIGWVNSQGHAVDEATLHVYPSHFSPAGMDFFALPDAESERGVYFSLIGIGGKDLELVRQTAKQWLSLGPDAIQKADSGAGLRSPFR
jgi:hypothetical protein